MALSGFEWIEVTTIQELADNHRTFIKGRAIEDTDIYKNVEIRLRKAVPPTE